LNNLIVNKINEHINIFEGMKLYGIAQSVRRGDQVMPAIIDTNGEAYYIGIDDIVPIQVYHKMGSVNVQLTGQGRGDSPGDIKNIYSNTMVVYMNQKRLRKSVDEVFLYLQANFPDRLQYKNFVINVRINSVILITQAVLNSEYENPTWSPGPEHNLFAINYTIESTFEKSCFENCPEC
jgi:hypothetical protein